jgi:hypothetical protein
MIKIFISGRTEITKEDLTKLEFPFVVEGVKDYIFQKIADEVEKRIAYYYWYVDSGHWVLERFIRLRNKIISEVAEEFGLIFEDDLNLE